MNPENNGEKTIENLRRVFFLCVVGFLIGDILGIQNFSIILYELCLGLIVVFFFLKEKFIIPILIISITIFGYNLGRTAYQNQLKEYNSLVKVTEGFTNKIHITGKVQKLVYRKERTNVYLVHFDNFDNFDKSTNIPLNKRINSVEQRDIKASQPTRIPGSFFAEIPSNLRVNLGDIIEFDGVLRSNISFPLTGYDRFAFFRGGYASIFLPKFTTQEKAEPSFTKNLEKSWENMVNRSFPREVAGVILGMTIGSTKLLTQEVKESFLQSGITHILVVSGSNIAFLLLFLTFFSKYLPTNTYFNLSIVVSIVLGYILIVGMEVPVIRAAIMGIISFLIASTGKRSSGRALIGIACIVLVLIDPLSPLFDAGFGLSFGATLGILLFQNHTESYFIKLRIPKFFGSILSLTIGASLGSLPVLIYHFGGFPINTLITNILISGFLGWILLSSTIFGIFSSLGIPFMKLLGFLIYIPVKTTIALSDYFRNGIRIEFMNEIGLYLTIFLFGVLIYHYIFEEKKLG